MKYLSKINTVEKKLAAAAFLLALLALIAGTPVNFIQYPGWEIRETTIDEENINLISAPALANRIKEKKGDFIVIDLRQKETFDRYHIPDALSFSDSLKIDTEVKNKIVFYDEENINPGYAKTIFKNYPDEKIYMLDGGMEMWKKLILFPDITHMTVTEKREIEKIAATSRYFGGRPKLPARLKPKNTGKYLREGC